MADFRFTCTHCGQDIECDELWSGHQIQCPTCKTELTVPPKPDAPPHAVLARAKPGEAKLSIGQSRSERSAAPPPPPPQMATLQQQLNQAKLAKKGNPVMKWVTVSVVVIVLGVAGYFGYGYYNDWQAKRSEAAKLASAPPPVTNAVPAEPPPPPKELPVIPAVWTLDLDKARTPNGKANGMISGTNFVAEIARMDKAGPTYLLRLLQGAAASPDLGVMIYLHVNAGESITEHTWTVSQDLKDATVPHVVKLWKPNPRYQAQQKTFYSGYAMKLELGQINNGVLPGKIFLALPDTEQSVVAGLFNASASLTNAAVAAGAGAVTRPVGAPDPRLAPGAPPPPTRTAADRRSGRKP